MMRDGDDRVETVDVWFRKCETPSESRLLLEPDWSTTVDTSVFFGVLVFHYLTSVLV